MFLSKEVQMRLGGLIVFLFAASLAFSQATPKGSPQFEEYPVNERWAGTPSPIKFKTYSDRLFRTQFKNAAKEPPDFAGHYRVASWGCGTNCVEAGIVDLSTGNLLRIPYSERHNSGWPIGEEKWLVCYSAFPVGDTIQTRRDSRLLVIQCADVFDRGNGDCEHKFHFVFEKNRFRKVGDEVGDCGS